MTPIDTAAIRKADPVKEARERLGRYLSHDGADFLGAINSDSLKRSDLRALLDALTAAEGREKESADEAEFFAREAQMIHDYHVKAREQIEASLATAKERIEAQAEAIEVYQRFGSFTRLPGDDENSKGYNEALELFETVDRDARALLPPTSQGAET